MSKKFDIKSFDMKIFKIFLFAYLSCAAITAFLQMNTTSIMALFFFVALSYMFKMRSGTSEKKVRIASVFCGVMFSLFICMFKLRWLIEQKSIFFFLSMPIGLFLFFEGFTNIVYSRLKDVCLCLDTDRNKKAKVFFISMAVMFLMWIPHLLKYYPGNITVDSLQQLNQAFGNDPLSNHHPILHTAIIKLLVGIGKAIFGDMQGGVAFFSVCQMLMLSAAFSYLVVTLYGYGYKKIVLVFVVLFYAVPAYHGDYSITMWKDIWFAAAAVVFCTTLWRLMISLEKDNKIPIFEGIMLAFSGLGFCLLRSNGLYAYVFMYVIFAVIYAKKNIKVVTLATGVLFVAVVIHGPIYSSLGAQPSEPTESLAIPQQQLAAVIKEECELPQEYVDSLSNLISVEDVKALYAPNNADRIKWRIRDNDGDEYIKEHKGELFKIWFFTGLKHPIIYTLAFIDQTCGYYYPDIQYWIYASQIVGNNFDGLKQECKLPEDLSKLYDNWVNAYKKYPVWGLLQSIGTMTWVCVFTLGLAFLNQRKKMLLVFIPIIGVILTILMATPIWAEFRYAYSVFATVPLFCTLPFYKKI